MGRVLDKVALVTGGSSGIGRGCAIRLAEEGAKVVVTDIDEEMGSQTVNAITTAGGQAMLLHHDVTQEADWTSVVEHVVSTWGGLHILVNNAGIAIGGSILDLSLADWQRQQAINLDGVFLGVRTAIPHMIASGYGSIINMSSVAGLKGSANLSAYNATKGGVRLFTKGVALECANSRWPIRVNSVHPGVIDTPIWTKVNPDIFAAGENTVDIDQRAQTIVPIGEVGYPSDIANGVLFLACEESRYITGTELVIDGGLSA
jgi:NAD(P)-dependent dehydrogenase (short-subunit alcohol dehydrogenase family)